MDTCRLCGGATKLFLDLGKVPLPEEFRKREKRDRPVIAYPLTLVFCQKCGHVQLGFQVSPDFIYKENYFYDCSVTNKALFHWQDLAQTLYRHFGLSQKDLVVDIGSNTGVLLSLFQSLNVRALGVDPALRLAQIAEEKGIPTIQDYFTPKVAKEMVEKYGQARVIACTNTFDHVSDLSTFMEGIRILLRKDGVMVIEVPYFLNMVRKLGHIVYHQQIDYMMLGLLIPFFRRFGMEITDCSEIPIHGGSLRIFVSFEGKRVVKKTIAKILRKERAIAKDWPKKLHAFANRVYHQRDEFAALIKKLKWGGKRVAGVGASAKGITFLNYCGLGRESIDFITEKSSLKVNRFTASGIPIVEDGELIRKKPDFAILLGWNFKEEIMKNLKEYRRLGGKFIIPVPKISII